MAKKFRKTVEDFTCLVCKAEVKGTGFTDHCLHCLFSKHVDILPGDRQSTCLGLMKPISSTLDHGQWQIIYRCQKCGYKHTNKISPEDNLDLIIELSTKPGYN